MAQRAHLLDPLFLNLLQPHHGANTLQAYPHLSADRADGPSALHDERVNVILKLFTQHRVTAERRVKWERRVHLVLLVVASALPRLAVIRGEVVHLIPERLLKVLSRPRDPCFEVITRLLLEVDDDLLAIFVGLAPARTSHIGSGEIAEGISPRNRSDCTHRNDGGESYPWRHL
jgi:hypothetical protein